MRPAPPSASRADSDPVSGRILLTGATGFIGRHLVRRLHAGPQPAPPLRALVRPASDTAELTAFGVELVAGELSDWDAVVAAVTGCARVVHLANVYSFWERDPSLYRQVNVEGTRRLAQAAAEAGVGLFLQVSTAAVFGRPRQVPFHEDSPPGPDCFSDYARSKREGDRVVSALAARHGMPLAILYPGSVLGAGDPKSSGRYIADVVGRRLPAALFSDDVMTWVHVRDVAEAIARLLARQDAGGARYIVGSHRLTLSQIGQRIRQASGVGPPRLALPDWLSTLCARMLTAAAAVTGHPPPWGLSTDLARTLTRGVQADGSRAARDLGLEYTDIAVAVADAVRALRGGDLGGGG